MDCEPLVDDDDEDEEEEEEDEDDTDDVEIVVLEVALEELEAELIAEPAEERVAFDAKTAAEPTAVLRSVVLGSMISFSLAVVVVVVKSLHCFVCPLETNLPKEPHRQPPNKSPDKAHTHQNKQTIKVNPA